MIFLKHFSASAFAFVPLPTTCVWIIYRVWRKETKTVCVARLGFSTVYVTLCLRYSMYWFPRYNVSFRQHFCMRQGQGQAHAPDQDRGQGHLSNSDEEGGIARRRVPRRTSSEIASAKIAGRPIPVKVSREHVCHAGVETDASFPCCFEVLKELQVGKYFTVILVRDEF